MSIITSLEVEILFKCISVCITKLGQNPRSTSGKLKGSETLTNPAGHKNMAEHIEPGSSENILRYNSIILQSVAVLFLDSNEAAIQSSLRLLSLNSLPLSFLHKWLTDVSHSGEQPVRCCQAPLLPYTSNMCVLRYGERMCFT